MFDTSRREAPRTLTMTMRTPSHGGQRATAPGAFMYTRSSAIREVLWQCEHRTSASVTDALAEIGLASVELKLDGIRVQAHKHGDDVRLFSRGLNDITAGLPGVVDLVRRVPATSIVLDGKSAEAVRYMHGPGSAVRTVHARREVVLCAGAANTPKLLLLSGIGGRDDRRDPRRHRRDWHSPRHHR